jgi:hypothetical protein
MKNKILLSILSLLVINLGYTQVSLDNNNPIVGNYVGFNNTSGIALPIQNQGFPEIDISSNGNNKFAINELGTWNGLNGLTRNNVQRTTMGLQGQTNLAWSMLHLWDDADGNLPGAMQRAWMNVGTSYTSNIDFMYSGLLERPNVGGSNLATDAVVAWGCQAGTGQLGNTDNFRFIFLQGLSGTPTGGAQTQQGLEVMRLAPTGNVGIGDFSSNGFGLAVQPSHTLDVIGTARLRQVPNNPSEVLITGLQQSAVGDYELNYLAFPNNANLYLDGTGNWSPGGADCRWEDVGSATGLGSTDIRTGFDLQDNCYRQNVIIGAISAKSKLAVEARTERDNSPIGVLFDITDSQPGFDPGSNNGVVTALLADASGINEDFGTSYVGIQARSVFGRNSVGVDSRADAGVGHSIGVYSVASNAQTTGSPAANIAYYGEVFDPNDVLLYQVGGTTWTTGPTINLSDENIKSDIENLENASSILNQLQPKTYQLVAPENRPIAFSDRLQYGLIAQEVLDVLPELVYETTVPELRDSSGAFLEGTSVDLLGVNYDALVPILVAGFNEQSGQVAAQAQIIEDQEETIEELENQLADLSESLGQLQESVAQLNAVVKQNQAKSNDCCERISNLMGDAEKIGKQSSLEQNVPNPFQDITQIDYNLATNGTVRLIITNELGQPIETLVNGEKSSGQHSVRWNASNQAPGVYYYTLYFNGDLITKKMIKL